MQVISLGYPYDPKKIPAGSVVLAEGFFDGVHLGHQQVIKTARQIADKQASKLAVMTFDVHPSVVFQHANPKTVRYLTSLDQKIALMAKLKVDYLYVLQFDQTMGSLDPQTFVDQYMVALHALAVVAGYDYTFGPTQIANMRTLPKFAANRFEVFEIPRFALNAQKVSSTRIRAELDAGHVDEANRLLGYDYATQGIVVHGEARGRTLGFPTANVQHDSNTRVPGIGIYAVQVRVNEHWYQAMASIGRNVTFGAGRPITVEIYLLNFSGDLYGQQMLVHWVHRLRGEVKFTGAGALVAQLKKDEQDTARYFSQHSQSKDIGGEISEGL